MSTNRSPEVSPTESIEQFEAQKAASEYEHAWNEAHQSATRGKRLAKQADKMVQAGQENSRAKMGRFPNRYPYHGVATDSVTMATNAELKAAGKNVKVRVYDSTAPSLDPDFTHDITLTKLGEHEQAMFDTAKNVRELKQAQKEANQSARRGRRLAKHVISMVESGETSGPAKMGRFPNRYPYSGVAIDSVTKATNAELKNAGKSITVDAYDSSVGFFDPTNTIDVVVKNIDGHEQPVPDQYLMRTDPDEWRRQRAEVAAQTPHPEQPEQ